MNPNRRHTEFKFRDLYGLTTHATGQAWAWCPVQMVTCLLRNPVALKDLFIHIAKACQNEGDVFSDDEAAPQVQKF